MKKLISFICGIFFLLFFTLSFAEPVEGADPSLAPHWYDDLFFSDKNFSFQFMRTLGYAYTGGADIGESISTSKIIPDADIEAWYQEWLKTADRIFALAEQSQKQKDLASAREAYLRSSNYYRTAGFYMTEEKNRERLLRTLGLSKSSFLSGIASMTFIQPVRIPYEDSALPGYLLRSPFKNSPLLIVMPGLDGTAEELYFQVGVAAYQRGYNVLIFEGPGQGDMIAKLNVPLRPDWELVITPVIDYAMTLPDINKNKIAVMGMGLGGYFAARGASSDKRIKACIVNGGFYDVYESILKRLTQDPLRFVKTNAEKFNATMTYEMKNSVTWNWFFTNAMWKLQVQTPADVMKKLSAYSLKEVAPSIKCPVLVVDSEGDYFNTGQPQELFAALTSPKTWLNFTKQDAAEAPYQMGALAISNGKIFNWLNGILS